MEYTYARIKLLTEIVYIFLTNSFKIYTIKRKLFLKSNAKNF